MQDENGIIGKLLKEARELHPEIRVCRAGEVYFAMTAEFSPNRLNVQVEGPTLIYETETAVIGGKTYTQKFVKGGLEEAMVVKAYWG